MAPTVPALANGRRTQAEKKAHALMILCGVMTGLFIGFCYHWYIGPPPTSPCWEAAKPHIPAYFHDFWRDMINKDCVVNDSLAIST